MTELDTIRRAKLYLEKLAQGIDPLTDTPVPENEIINHVRLSRCFTFVAGVLEKVIENGGVEPKKLEFERTPPTPYRKKSDKEPFSISLESRVDFPFSQSPISLAEITRRINALSHDDRMKRLTNRNIRDWLIDIGMLNTYTTSAGRVRTVPSARGEELGITRENQTGINGSYLVSLYNTDAQWFIVDNLDAIIDRIKQQ